MRSNHKGFTLLEIVMAVVLVGIIMIPVSAMITEFVLSSVYADSSAISSNLAALEMSIANTISFNNLTGATYTNYAGYDYDLERVITVIDAGIKKIAVKVFFHPRAQKPNPLYEVTTYSIGDNIVYGGGSCGAKLLGAETDYFTTRPPTIMEKDRIFGVAYTNNRNNGNLTVVALKITCSRHRQLNNFDVDGRIRLNRPFALSEDETYVNLYSPFFVRTNTTYGPDVGGGIFYFQGGPDTAYTLSVKYIFYDGTESGPYQYTYTPSP